MDMEICISARTGMMLPCISNDENKKAFFLKIIRILILTFYIKALRIFRVLIQAMLLAHLCHHICSKC